MGTQRTSNKDIADKLDTLITILTANAQAQAPVIEPVAVSEPVVAQAPTEAGMPKIEAKYEAHMSKKVAALTAKDGEPRVLYVRKNLHGETKLAYCLHSRWKSLKDNGLIGAIKMFN